MTFSVSPARATWIAGLASMFGLLPVWLTSGLAAFMGDIGIDERRLGFSVATFFGSSALFALYGGRLSDRFGARRAISVGLVVSSVSMLAVSTVTTDWRHLLPILAIAGAASTVLQPAANLLIATEVPQARQGVAIGLKQAAIPSSTLLTGAAVPIIGSTSGWRPAFVLAAVMTAVLVIWTREPRRAAQSKGSFKRSASSPYLSLDLLALLVAAGAAVAATTAGSSFLVVYSFSIGVSAEFAGAALSIASLAIIVVRVVTGWLADRLHSSGMVGMSILMLVGALGAGLLAAGVRDAALIFAAALMLGAGWGWNALMVLAIVRRYPHATGRASGLALIAVRIGSAGGPATFGLLATTVNYRAAWSMNAVLLLIGSGLGLWLRTRWDAVGSPA